MRSFAWLLLLTGCGRPASLTLDLFLSGAPQPASLRVTLFGHGRVGQATLDVHNKTFPGNLRITPLDVSQPDPRVLVDGLDGAGVLVGQAATRYRSPLPGQDQMVVLTLGPPLHDVDQDGVPDVIDDCPTDYDPDQLCVVRDASVADDAGDSGVASGIQLLSVTSQIAPLSLTNRLGIPAPTVPAGSLLLAWFGFGYTANTAVPTIMPPSGWSLVRRTDNGTAGTLAVYSHIAADTDPVVFNWQTNQTGTCIGWIAAYSGVDTSALTAGIGEVLPIEAMTYSAPSVRTGKPNSMVVTSIYGRDKSSATTLWSASADLGVDVLANLWSGSYRSGAGVESLQPAVGITVPVTFSTSPVQSWVIVDVAILSPAP